MEIDNVQTQATAITPARPPEETEAPAPETTETRTVNPPAATAAFEVEISEEARTAAQNEQQASENLEAEAAAAQGTEPEVVQVYNNAARIGG